jgi:hypothetical protein
MGTPGYGDDKKARFRERIGIDASKRLEGYTGGSL